MKQPENTKDIAPQESKFSEPTSTDPKEQAISGEGCCGKEQLVGDP